ncbi:helix-turn-helix domain-containing protein [Neisseria wadsworthii]|uniref:helix-turn-helix domain-containing protein n=2 Tax=Neisseria wadsworthii TaxID=607711 RepID=UPI00058FD770|nr:helix-turn-helix domain-containing protein [Neisseria wadsworthii]QMT36507.1 helix-turn-helix domain-containing protein [Neisseria wadsworthii]
MSTYDVEAAAEYCKCHPETIREHIRAGRLVASKPGRKYCITQSALDAFLNGLENDAVQASLTNRSEEKCLSTKETMAYGTLTSQRQAAAELDSLLALKTRKRPKSCMTN